MSATNKLRARGVALEQLQAARTALGAALDDLLKSRARRCRAKCPGWTVVSPRLHFVEIRLCSECASLNGYDGLVTEEDVCALPAAKRELARRVQETTT